MRIKAVLFDLDGTLLDLDLHRFLGRYFDALERVTAPLLDGASGSTSVREALHIATQRMLEPHDGRTNQDVFFAGFAESTGVDLHCHAGVYERFYREVFPALADGARPAPGARQAVETALGLGMCVAIATNPMFPREAIEHRLAWAGLSDLPVDLITSYETMHACKPHLAYYLETACMLGVDPSMCVMVGDDAELDMPAAAAGMLTHYVGRDPDVAAHSRGDLAGFASLLREGAIRRERHP